MPGLGLEASPITSTCVVQAQAPLKGKGRWNWRGRGLEEEERAEGRAQLGLADQGGTRTGSSQQEFSFGFFFP